jgi:hypothetical protein
MSAIQTHRCNSCVRIGSSVPTSAERACVRFVLSTDARSIASCEESSTHAPRKEHIMGIVRAGVAGLAAWKWGGGLIGTIIIFLLVYWLLGVIF